VNEYPCKLVTVVTEAILESQICAWLRENGASGYTVTDARGSGSRGARTAGWGASGNVRIEVLCNLQLADRIAKHMQENYYQDYAMVMFITDAAVLRPQKFT